LVAAMVMVRAKFILLTGRFRLDLKLLRILIMTPNQVTLRHNGSFTDNYLDSYYFGDSCKFGIGCGKSEGYEGKGYGGGHGGGGFNGHCGTGTGNGKGFGCGGGNGSSSGGDEVDVAKWATLLLNFL